MMKIQLLTLAAVLAVSTTALADANFERTLNVSGQPDLYVSTGSGTIRVHPGSDNQIHITGHVHAGWSAFGDVQSRVQRVADNPPIAQSGNTIRIGENFDHMLFNNISIDYEITVPRSTALNLRSGSGRHRSRQRRTLSLRPQRLGLRARPWPARWRRARDRIRRHRT
jgi:hypothetical protein